jgi:hypothetical protein
MTEQEKIQALGALASSIAAENAASERLRLTTMSHNITETAQEENEESEHDLFFEARTLSALVQKQLASESLDLAIDVRKRLHSLCNKVGLL